MKINTVIKTCALGVCVIGLTACSSTRHGGGAGVTDGSGGPGANGAYAQGYDGNSGFQPSVSCNVPGNAQAYYFEFNSNDVHSEDLARLQGQAQKLAGNNAHISVVGNTDSRGSREYNVALGWRRANAVSEALQQGGISKGQIATNSNGAEKPIAFGTSEDDYQCNRRVDVQSN